MKKMKELPEPIQRQILIRFASGGCVALAAVIFSAAYRDITFLPVLIIGAALVISGLRVWDKAGKGAYLMIQGVCKQIETTRMKKQIKTILISAETKSGDTVRLKVHTRRRKNSAWIGCAVEVCMDRTAALYDQEGVYLVEKYLYLRTTH